MKNDIRPSGITAITTFRTNAIAASLCLCLFASSSCRLFRDKKDKECAPTPTEPCGRTEQPLFGTGLKLADAVRTTTFYAAAPPYSGAALPPSADLSDRLPTPGSQGMQNSCVGWAIAYGLKSYQERVEQGWTLNTTAHLFSPAYIYNQLNGGRDAGLYMDQALNLVQSQGVAPLSSMPYNPADFTSQPTSAARSAASPFTIDKWGRVDPNATVEIKAHLNAGTPVVIGARFDYAFQELAPGAVWRRLSGPVVGGHAMLVVGYDDSRRAFKLLNSWGTTWSSGGYGWIDYDFFPQVVSEAYVTLDSKKSPNTPSPAPPTPGPGPTPSTLETVIARTTLAVTNVDFNSFAPNGEPAMRFNGSINIPSGATATSFQIVIYFYLNDGRNGKGQPVRALYPQFSTATGFAATGIPAVPFPTAGLNTSWFAIMPYFGLSVPRGGALAPITTNLVAEPVLYVNNFALRTFPVIPFFVRL